MQRILNTVISAEEDVVVCRQRARAIAKLLGFVAQDQTRIATAVSELARNVIEYASSGRVEFAIEGETVPQLLIITIRDSGPGIANLADVLSGQYKSPNGMGLGIVGARRLMDQFSINSDAGKGTTIVLKKLLPREAGLVTAARLGDLVAKLQTPQHGATLDEVHLQNRELLATLDELKARQEELVRLTQELEDTNRGVVALYAELDEKADHLRRADEMKTRFLSNMSHEFRTPLSSIRAIAKLLIERIDGDLNSEQEKQVNFILKNAEALSELVNDLLDLAKIEAGKIELHPAPFSLSELFSALRGMLRPLLVTPSIKLEFDPVPHDLVMTSDEGKVSQILRNFISNALKFTERGEVRVSAALSACQTMIALSVKDTGMGIAPEHQQLIFEEFTQVPNPAQKKFKGTGLGLPLCRQLAAHLGGSIHLESTLGVGSTFTVTLPVTLPSHGAPVVLPSQDDAALPGTGVPILLIEDQQETVQLYKKYLDGSPYVPMVARSTQEADELWRKVEPKAIVLDIMLNRVESWQWLARVKADSARSHIPILVATDIDDKGKGLALGADAYFIKPLLRRELLEGLRRCVSKASLFEIKDQDGLGGNMPISNKIH
ncbi:signal transduction histidine kinase [Paucimonas lemoignei]|uniref:histidine kinase n=1 Tax=Paucimonas lemoignei TaxID=29443 RepID=A0A4R3HS79_PAULE|nr:ATP-binding protein [Paucimonas lemoignei]TCS35182.1 signal transduction histidine kinase [Paucimonas lemoignei]